VTQTRVEQHKAIKVGIVRVELVCLVEVVKIVDVGCDFHFVG